MESLLNTAMSWQPEQKQQQNDASTTELNSILQFALKTASHDLMVTLEPKVIKLAMPLFVRACTLTVDEGKQLHAYAILRIHWIDTTVWILHRQSGEGTNRTREQMACPQACDALCQSLC